jgi:hypothetical protein
LVVPEQGMRLQAATTEGLTQLDPQKSGIRQKGVLAFRVLQAPWTLSLDLEQVEPWVQVTSLQHATFSEALVKVAANLQYQIENTGLKLLGVYLPTNADNVRFQGEQLADFRPVPGAVTNELQLWEIKLHRRVIGPYLLQATYQTLLPEHRRTPRCKGSSLPTSTSSAASSRSNRPAGWPSGPEPCPRRCNRPSGKAFRRPCERTCRRLPPTWPAGWLNPLSICR